MEELCAGPLVRAICPDGVAIWTEWKRPGEVMLRVLPEQGEGDSPQAHAPLLGHTRTVTVGGRHYALSVLKGLQTATWHTYRLSHASKPDEPELAIEDALYCFRTLDPPHAGKALRLAYGSCRNESAPGPDALSSFGRWLRAHLAERETLWPHLLLLLGDQIYADGSPGQQVRTFEEFAQTYVRAWTEDVDVRQLLAMVPSAMIFDDHEITNSWNIVPHWQARALQQGWEQTLVDGLVAYWLYQGWGNVGLWGAREHDLLATIEQARQSGEDALEALRARVRQAIYQEKALQWDYTLPTTPPIFVADLRADRSIVLNQEQTRELHPRILSPEQMQRLRAWAQEHTTSTIILASSVPALLPPLIGYAEYLMGKRLFQGASFNLARRLSRFFFARQQRFSQQMGFEHWPAFHTTWRELAAFFANRANDILILSGDVHFSYAMAARSTRPGGKKRPILYQLVASPFRNVLGSREKRLILAQSWLRRAMYGGLSQRVLPLIRENAAQAAPPGMLLQNVIALVTCQPFAQSAGNYEIKQVYMGVANEACVMVGSTLLKPSSR